MSLADLIDFPVLGPLAALPRINAPGTPQVQCRLSQRDQYL
jgi:hypothetical protein